MEDFGNYKIIVYLVLALLYFLFTGRKKKPTSSKPAPSKESRIPQTKVSKPLSHETKQIKPVPSNIPPVASPVPNPFSLEEILKEFGVEETPKKQEAKEETVLLEDVKPSVVDYEENVQDEVSSRHSVLEESNEDSHFQPYATSKKASNKYAAMFKDPESLKKVFVAQEIFNRKHF